MENAPVIESLSPLPSIVIKCSPFAAVVSLPTEAYFNDVSLIFTTKSDVMSHFSTFDTMSWKYRNCISFWATSGMPPLTMFSSAWQNSFGKIGFLPNAMRVLTHQNFCCCICYFCIDYTTSFAHFHTISSSSPNNNKGLPVYLEYLCMCCDVCVSSA